METERLDELTAGPSMIQVGGLWVHQGTAEPGADLENIVDAVREERILAVCQMPHLIDGTEGEEPNANSE
jgi:hypothetical protein